jgi:hypothetical protein
MRPNGLISCGNINQVGRDLRDAYLAASPFPHVVIDDFLPEDILEMCLAEFPASQGDGAHTFDRAQERLKTQFNPDTLSDNLRNLFYSFNSRPFIKILENITSIKGLVPDPYFLGGGFHEIGQGGHLSIHADFNHHKPMDLERRINVLIYLNKNWKDDYGGQLEFWDDDMKNCVQSVLPVFNRCVIFNTTSRSWHGNPNPVNHPDQITRKSIALYYYTATWSDTRREHTTQFRVRQGVDTKHDWQVQVRELADDLLPPIIRRNLTRLRRKPVAHAHD